VRARVRGILENQLPTPLLFIILGWFL